MFEDLQDTHVNRRKRKREEADLDITPMIDVTFLLLIFFIVASRMDPQNAVDMPTAKHGSTVSDKAAAVIVMENSGKEEPNVYLGSGKDPSVLIKGSLDDNEQAITDYIDELLHGSKPKTAVLIKAEQGIRFRYVNQVAGAASRAMDNDMKLHFGVIEKQ